MRFTTFLLILLTVMVVAALAIPAAPHEQAPIPIIVCLDNQGAELLWEMPREDAKILYTLNLNNGDIDGGNKAGMVAPQIFLNFRELLIKLNAYMVGMAKGLDEMEKEGDRI